ncbi:hypothetical protein ES703_07977 [subsurface metagenome]
MANYRPYLDYVGWAEDDSDSVTGGWGVWQAPTSFLYIDNIVHPTLVQEELFNDARRQLETAHVDDHEEGTKREELTISGPVPITCTDNAFLWLLKHAQAKVVSTPSGAAHTHVFTPYNTFPTLGLSVTVGIGGKERTKMSGCRIKSFKLSGDIAGFMRFECTFTGIPYGRDQTMDDPSYTLLSSDPKYWTSPGATVTLEFPTGSALSNFHSWEFTITPGVGEDPVLSGQLGSAIPVQLPRLNMSASGIIKRRADFADGAGANQSIFKEYFDAETDCNMMIKYEGATIPGGGAAEKYTLQIDAHVMIPLNKPVIPTNEGGLYMESAELACREDDTNEPITLTTISGVATPADCP